MRPGSGSFRPASLPPLEHIVPLAKANREHGPLVAVLFFIGTLFPAWGFVNVYPMRFSFVADHFQYLASIGLIVLAAKLLATAPISERAAGKPAVAALLLTLGCLTFHQSLAYRDAPPCGAARCRKTPTAGSRWIILALMPMREAIVARHLIGTINRSQLIRIGAKRLGIEGGFRTGKKVG